MNKVRFSITCILVIFQMSIAAQTGSLVNGKIPIDAARWYQVNNTSNGVEALFGGKLNQNVSTGWSLILPNWDAWYPVLKGEVIELDKIRMYDWEGSNASQPMTIFAIDDKWQRIPIARFTGLAYDKWVGPYVDSPTVFMLNTPIKNIQYIVINTSGFYPSEIEFYGNYKSPTPLATAAKHPAPLKNQLGTNGFEWTLLSSKNSNAIDEVTMQLATAFTGFRHYMDWDRLEQSEGSYTYNPIYAGNWNLDLMYERCKTASLTVLACIKGIPVWMQNTYPSTRRNNENVPVKFGSDFSLPASYIEQAKMAFQFAARYGSNKNISPALLSVNSKTRWTGDPANTVKIGLDLIKYIECNNEQDKWWKGRDAYQSGREYAANLSAFYDGNKNTMGAGVGVKNADPNMKVVTCGTASEKTDYVRGMIDWCIQFRGYLPDGSVNYCWDIINYHFYNNDAKTSQNGSSVRGAAPELAGFADAANAFVKMSQQFSNNMPIWLTETGYDILNTNSAQAAIAIGAKSTLETQADWTLRTSLLAARAGIDRLFFYEMYDDNALGGQYGTCGFLNASNKTRRPAADYSYQLNQNFGSYLYQETIQHNPEIDRYEWNGQSMYAIWMPTENGTTLQYNWKLDKMDSVAIYKPTIGTDLMTVQKLKTNVDSIAITISETPIFIIPTFRLVDIVNFSVAGKDSKNVTLSWTISSDSSISFFTIEKLNEVDKKFYPIATIPVNATRSKLATYSYLDKNANEGANHYRIKPVMTGNSFFYSKIVDIYFGSMVAFPNPFSNAITVQGLAADKVAHLKLIASNGSIVKAVNFTSTVFQWNLSDLASGNYLLVVENGNGPQAVKMNKLPSK